MSGKDSIRQSVIGTMPREATHNYGHTRPLHTNLAPHSQVGLTIAGLRYVKEAEVLVADHCMLIGILGTIRSGISLDPFANEGPRVTMEDVSGAFFAAKGWPPAPIASSNGPRG